jgi:PrcB C-terminal
MTGSLALVAVVAALAAGAPAEAKPVPFRTVAQDDGTGSGERRGMTIRGERRWRRVWRSLAPGEPRPAIDFRRRMLIAVTQGRQPSGGHEIEVVRIERGGGGWLVRVVEREPAPGCPAAGVLTSPFHVVRVKRSRAPVRFERRRAEVDCR